MLLVPREAACSGQQHGPSQPRSFSVCMPPRMPTKIAWRVFTCSCDCSSLSLSLFALWMQFYGAAVRGDDMMLIAEYMEVRRIF